MAFSGLLLIKARDPISRLTIKFSQTCPFSAIGFYFRRRRDRDRDRDYDLTKKDHQFNPKEINVTILDILTCDRPMWWPEEFRTLEHLCRNFHIEKIYYRPFTINVDEKTLSDLVPQPVDLLYALQHLFFKNGQISTIQIVNSVLIGLASEYDDRNNIIKQLKKNVLVYGSIEDKIEITKENTITDTFYDYLMKNYLIDSTYLDKMMEFSSNLFIKKPFSKPHPKILKNHLDDVMYALSDLIVKDDKFFPMIDEIFKSLSITSISKRITNDKKDNENEKDNDELNIVQGADELLSIFNIWIKEGYINYEKIFCQMMKLRLAINKRWNGELNPIPYLNRPKILLFKELDNKKIENNGDIDNFDEIEEFKNSITNLGDNIRSISEACKNGEEGKIYINELIKAYNNIQKYTDIGSKLDLITSEQLNEHNGSDENNVIIGSLPSVIIIEENNASETLVPLNNKYKKITNRNFCIDDYDENELKIILETLLKKKDRKWDDVLKNITKKIALLNKNAKKT